MEIIVRSIGISDYFEVYVKTSNAQIESGLLNEDERKELATKFLQAASRIN